MPGQIRQSQLAARLRSAYDRGLRGMTAGGPVKFRLPTSAALKAEYTSGNVPEKVIQDRIAMALTRMQQEGRLKVSDPVADIIKRVFPSPGVFDEAEYAKVVDVADPSKIYKNVFDAQTTVNSVDKVKLTAVINDAIKLIDKSIADTAGLKQVFGSKHPKAKAVYGQAKQVLKNALANMDALVSTDYNLDDREVGLGGWASHASQHMHLEVEVAQAKDPAEAQITVIHEACHLADPAVDDQGYYSPGPFVSMSEDEKVGNAAHYEEVPRRILGISLFNGMEFKPGKTASGAALTLEDKVKREVDEYFRKAWDKAVDVHTFLRRIRQEVLAGNKKAFDNKKTRIMELSKLMRLTVHEQNAASAAISAVDIISAEGVAHGMTQIQAIVGNQGLPSPAPETQAFYVKKFIDDSIKAYNALTGSFASDRALTDWLVKEYRKAL